MKNCEWIAKSLGPEVFWVMVTAIFTIALFLVAWKQLRDLARTSRTDLLFRLRKDFFDEKARTITFLLDNAVLRFNPDEPPVQFDIDQKTIRTKLKAITAQLMDEYLGLLEDIGGLWKAKHLSLKEVYDSFGYYVTLACENQAIKEYVAWARAQEGKAGTDIYQDLFDLYSAIKKLENKKK